MCKARSGPFCQSTVSLLLWDFLGHQCLGLARIVASTVIGIYLGLVAGLFEPLAPAIALPALTRMSCRWRCERQRQDGGIHRHAAGNVRHSLVSSLPTGPPSFGR